MAEFLSPEWVAELDGAAGRSPALAGLVEGEALTIEQRVCGGPPGEVRYHMRLADGDIHFVFGPASKPDVLLVLDYSFAVEIHRGERNAQDALAAGALEVRGDLDRLLRRADALSAMGDAFAAVRAATTFDHSGPLGDPADLPPPARR